MSKTRIHEDEDVTLKDLAAQVGVDPNMPDDQIIMALSQKFTQMKGPPQTGAQPPVPPRPAYPMMGPPAMGAVPQPRPFGMSQNLNENDEDEGDDDLRPIALSGTLLNVVKDARTMKLDRLVERGVITPAIRKDMAEKYLKDEVIAFSHMPDFNDGFDDVVKLLEKNGTVVPKGRTGPQSGVVALSKNGADAQERDYLNENVDARRKAAGLSN